ncbi:MAG TPA: serpin family protein [Gemmatimonadaceae bacterium]|nr:serpin family protein [Gemmatimonadaceae bacterium]
MIQIRRTSWCLALAAVVAACSDPISPGQRALRSLSPAEQQIASSGNAFSFALFRQLASSQASQNVFVSPLSASMSLGMTINGAAGGTFEAMRTALRLGGADMASIDAGYRGLIDALRGADPATTFQIANSIWYRNTFAFKQPFLDTTAKYFDAHAQGLDFDNEAASLATINRWVNDNTAGKIPTILDQITPDEVMFLINTVYFKGTWQVRFDPKSTTPGRFVDADGTVQTVPMMSRPEHLKPEFRSGGWQGAIVVELPYGDGEFAMDILMPPMQIGVDSLAKTLNDSTWSAMAATLRDNDAALILPKFSMSYERMLNDDLTSLGMGVAFTDAAEFPGISPQPVRLSFVKQKAFVSVDEAGTEAGASTVTGVVPTSLSYIAIDHPFVFVIRDRTSGTILFMGKVVRIPAASDASTSRDARPTNAPPWASGR